MMIRALFAVLFLSALCQSCLGFMPSAVGCVGKSLAAKEASHGIARRDAHLGPVIQPLRRSGMTGLRCELIQGFSTNVKQLHRLEDFRSAKHSHRIIFVALAASHCRKCHAVAGKFSAVAQKFVGESDVAFATVHLDKVRGVAQETGVKKTPTFQVYRDGEMVAELIGADEVSIVASKIKALVHEWAGKRDLVDPAKQVVTAYSPSEGEEISKGEDSQAETSVPDLSEASEQEPQCGDDGCEISWD